MYVYMCQGSVISSVLSHLNKNLKQQTSKSLACHSSQTDCVIALGQIGVTALSYSQFYLENNRKIHPHRACPPKRHEEKREPQPCGSSFYMFYSFPLGQLYVNWASQEYCLFYLRSSLQSSDLPLFYFHRLFPSLSFSHHHSGLLFPVLTFVSACLIVYLSMYLQWVLGDLGDGQFSLWGHKELDTTEQLNTQHTPSMH